MTGRRSLRSVALLAGLTLALGACTSGDGSTGADDTPSASSEAVPTADPEAVVESFGVVVGGGEATVDVHPLVRSGEHLVLTFDLRPVTLPDGDDDLAILGLLVADVTSRPAAGGAVRLVDLGDRSVFLPGVDSEGWAVGEPSDLWTVPAEGLRVQRAYAAPPDDVEALGLLFPGHYVPIMPIIDAEAPAPALTDDGASPLDLASVADAPQLALHRYTTELDDAVRVLESTESVEVSLGGDVLFASDSADLGPQGQAALTAAVAHLDGRAGGVIDVVGHTDDVGDDASNQDLSERRAAAAVEALAGLVDTDRFELRPAGRGESQPLVANDSAESRQLNRRVVLTLTSQVTTRTQVPSDGELPPFEGGPTATGAEGVEVDGPRPFRITAPEAVRVGDCLLVTVEAEALDTEVDSSFGVGGLSAVGSYRGDRTVLPQHALSVAVVSGTTAVYPYDYPLGDGSSGLQAWRPLADLDTLRRIDGGQTLTFVGLYPAIADTDTIAVQVRQALGAFAFRLTDIPVAAELETRERSGAAS
ncbi:OmpA family protein [Xylanimonas ulmi]|uniref:Outer membrane protein OmpA-like peptidoglycan-associated protein n=1 Tax=Xylanimonas ulmi TaxID=228973 RepID=A0A4Q7M1U5_9MICO|nr:OmpA family protein [Xylanibacterium ulmi]RZS60368.1 outer membrane protein OmpA-like peptidoglycan-associated protein [Xylanibacterium ulmi]